MTCQEWFPRLLAPRELGELTTLLILLLAWQQFSAESLRGLRPEDVALVWSDTQGFESEVIASGSSLWKAGVPLWVEVAPQALEIHGGVSRFESLCREHFRQLVLDEQFLDAGRGQTSHPVERIGEVLRKLQQGKDRCGRDEQDVLLIPLPTGSRDAAWAAQSNGAGPPPRLPGHILETPQSASARSARPSA